MEVYVGYGFDTNDIPASAWLSLVEKYDAKEFEDFIEEGYDANEEFTQEDKEQAAVDFIEGGELSISEYLKNIINSNEASSAGTDYIVSSYDNYLVFDNIRFADDSPRTKYIRNREEFIRLISKYVPTDNIKFGNLYDGVEWADPCYFLD